MQRRDFLGSILGFVASHSFLAKLAIEDVQRFPDLPIVEDYKIVFTDKMSGYCVQAPGIKAITSLPHNNSHIEAHALDVHKALKVTHCILLDKSNHVLSCVQFSNGYHSLILGGKLKVTLDVSNYAFMLGRLPKTVKPNPLFGQKFNESILTKLIR